MKWRSHRAITREVCAALGVEDRYCELMVAGAVEPDRHHEVRRDRYGWRRLRHHGSPDRVVLMFIWKARKAYLEGDLEEASRDMGRALHYIQDRSLSKGWSGRSHDRREAAVAARPVPLEAISLGLEGAISSPCFVRQCVIAARKRRDPTQVIFQATMISAAVAKAVVSDPDPPPGLERAVRRSQMHYLILSWPLAGALSIAMLLMTIGQPLPWAALSALPLVMPVTVRSRYRRLLRLADWYGLNEAP